MIYSVLQQKQVPVTVEKETRYIDNEFDDMVTRYSVYDSSGNMEYVGYLDLLDKKNGIRVLYIKNENPDHYKHFADVADQIKVEHCLNRKIDKPYIESVAALNTYVLHFKRGLRFLNEGVNSYLDSITRNLQKGERITTEPLGYQKMFMPANMINRIKENIKCSPLLKGLK